MPTTITATLTCHTSDCVNAEIPIVVEMPEDASAMCGACSQEITDIQYGDASEDDEV